MLLLIEGMDNTGKTTLARSLRDTLKWPLLADATVRGKDLGQKIKWHMHQMVLAQDNDIIFDRHSIISEHVYGTVLLGKNILAESPDWPALLQHFKRTRPLIIYCRPPDEVVLKFEDGREQMGGVVENGKRLLDMYDMTMEQVFNYVPVVKYDYTTSKVEDILPYIETHKLWGHLGY